MAMSTISLLLSAAFGLNGAAGAKGAESRSQCPTGWFQFGSRCIMFVDNTRTWLLAERYCVHFGANLASIHSSEEYHFVQELIILQTEDFTPAWIGGFDAVQNRVWLWSDGSRFDYRNWLTGEPNNVGGREPCMMMNDGGEKRWNDIQCGSIFPSVCSKRLC
ncbi:ladderlectin-like [Oncorhynchus clarkii lewisi]|uniref:ladderlectin-like n=1 Tax=Oncorhynchus clarkii lewisi TaxID=490388 RepID=UPI0039B905D4